MKLKWKRARDGFVETHCGRGRIVPLYCGCTRAQCYQLWLDDKEISSFCETQREAKELASEHTM